jgi:hypothetical protein
LFCIFHFALVIDRSHRGRQSSPTLIEPTSGKKKHTHTHTHTQGYLRSGFDSIDAFMTHMWAVTVTGAPKARAMAFIEQHEKVRVFAVEYGKEKKIKDGMTRVPCFCR